MMLYFHKIQYIIYLLELLSAIFHSKKNVPQSNEQIFIAQVRLPRRPILYTTSKQMCFVAVPVVVMMMYCSYRSTMKTYSHA